MACVIMTCVYSSVDSMVSWCYAVPLWSNNQTGVVAQQVLLLQAAQFLTTVLEAFATMHDCTSAIH